ncbi:hypothetical protein MKJ04_17820 [Pontibacter sp. E15-1]|uniref:hypothetical protein n=1 Tax=Pontibacter sp. E15-1 TaxID=2919918 RepID=UPI001F4F9EDF|nr:hypothetical protein [Pontibacter sp. E15-1]MCJ8166709.1 hypothetical protein [Pontibacter sp. E15-1]
MKKIALAFVFTFATFAGFAQTTGAKQPAKATTQPAQKSLEQRADEITAGMARNLRLTPEQTSKIRSINRTSMQSAEAAKQKYKKEPRLIVQQMDMISQTRLSQLKDVLSPIQFQQYQQRREEKMGVPREAQSNPSQPGATHQESY